MGWWIYHKSVPCQRFNKAAKTNETCQCRPIPEGGRIESESEEEISDLTGGKDYSKFETSLGELDTYGDARGSEVLTSNIVEYLCPSGQKYLVTDSGSNCGSINASGGRQLSCGAISEPAPHKFIDCANSGTDQGWAQWDNVHQGGSSVYGGLYKCPSGRVYAVSASSDDCKGLQGTGGKMVNCQKKSGPWSGRSAICKEKKPAGVNEALAA